MGTTDRTGIARGTGQTVEIQKEVRGAPDHQRPHKLLFDSVYCPVCCGAAIQNNKRRNTTEPASK